MGRPSHQVPEPAVMGKDKNHRALSTRAAPWTRLTYSSLILREIGHDCNAPACDLSPLPTLSLSLPLSLPSERRPHQRVDNSTVRGPACSLTGLPIRGNQANQGAKETQPGASFDSRPWHSHEGRGDKNPDRVNPGPSSALTWRGKRVLLVIRGAHPPNRAGEHDCEFLSLPPPRHVAP